MTVNSHPAAASDIERLWPIVRGARIFDGAEEFSAFYEAEPWRVRVDERGDAAVLERWRAHLDVLAVRGLWTSRLGRWIAEIEQVAALRGYRRVLSPLLPASMLRSWLAEGMTLAEPIVALQGTPSSVRRVAAPEGVTIRPGRPEDVAAASEVDAQGFSDFWRLGGCDLENHAGRERFTVAERGGAVIGYTLCTSSQGSGVLSRLAVAADERHRGVGSALLSDAAAYVERAGAIALTLCTQESNAASRAMYRRLGMVEVEEPYGLAIATVGEGQV